MRGTVAKAMRRAMAELNPKGVKPLLDATKTNRPTLGRGVKLAKRWALVVATELRADLLARYRAAKRRSCRKHTARFALAS